MDSRDPDHERCGRLLLEAAETRVIPAPVLPELDYLLQRAIGPHPFLKLLAEINAGIYVVRELNAADYLRVGQLCETYSDPPIGFVDAAVLAIVERLGEPKLATLDRRHFALMRPRHVEALRLLPE